MLKTPPYKYLKSNAIEVLKSSTTSILSKLSNSAHCIVLGKAKVSLFFKYISLSTKIELHVLLSHNSDFMLLEMPLLK